MLVKLCLGPSLGFLILIMHSDLGAGPILDDDVGGEKWKINADPSVLLAVEDQRWIWRAGVWVEEGISHWATHGYLFPYFSSDYSETSKVGDGLLQHSLCFLFFFFFVNK